jgi:hypothetical protein
MKRAPNQRAQQVQPQPKRALHHTQRNNRGSRFKSPRVRGPIAALAPSAVNESAASATPISSNAPRTVIVPENVSSDASASAAHAVSSPSVETLANTTDRVITFSEQSLSITTSLADHSLPPILVHPPEYENHANDEDAELANADLEDADFEDADFEQADLEDGELLDVASQPCDSVLDHVSE